MFTHVIFNNTGEGSIEEVNEIIINLVYLAGGSFLASFMGLLLDKNKRAAVVEDAGGRQPRHTRLPQREGVQLHYEQHSITIIGCYVVGFFMMWRLALMASPIVVLLVIPDIIYNRILLELAWKMGRM
ncbi:hypothetical protein ZIOFF_070388 [Zingiber officinale]|uniref:Uncharacterized protein n=1 Tax=Zingiber officinale TaxID=94328 RepID=A0A8J5EQM3_ZINOF|nr:hypothetical protein ZIOFF_070388 [Zingiber officinale]